MESSQNSLGPGRGQWRSLNSQAMAHLQDLALRWFTETQAPLILQNGILPPWFHGFITRKQTEELLKDKALGAFLIRLSDRATGYILSYRGSDRCRHFVINQLPDRRYLVSGDVRSHGTLAQLVSHYQQAQLEPFRETLTVACPREDSELYDAISLGLHHAVPPATVSLPGASEQASSPRTSPKPQESFLHMKKSPERQETVSKEEDEGAPEQVPPLPERSTSLLDKPAGGLSDIIYADLRKGKQVPGGLGKEAPGRLTAGPSQEAPQRLSDATPGPSGSPSNRGLCLCSAAGAPGLSPVPWSQGLQPNSPDGAADAYKFISPSRLAKQGDSSTYEPTQVCGGGLAWCPPRTGSGPLDCSYDRISGEPLLLDLENTYEQIPAARNKDPGRAQKPEKLRKMFFADKKPKA